VERIGIADTLLLDCWPNCSKRTIFS